MRRTWREQVERRIHQISAILKLRSQVKRVDFRYGTERFTAVIIRLVYKVARDGTQELHSLLEIRLYSDRVNRSFNRMVKIVEKISGTEIGKHYPYEAIFILQHYVSLRYTAYASYWVWGLRRYRSELPSLLRELARAIERENVANQHKSSRS